MKKKIGWILVLAVVLLACIGAALAFFWPENSAPTIAMTRVGSFQTPVPMEDTIALPSALEGSGIHVLDGQGESLKKRGVLQLTAIKDLNTMFVVLYNCQPTEDTVGLLIFGDSRQLSYQVDKNDTAQFQYQTTLPPFSYTVIPLSLQTDENEWERGTHDLWFVNESRISQTPNVKNPLPYFTIDSHLKLVLDGGQTSWTKSQPILKTGSEAGADFKKNYSLYSAIEGKRAQDNRFLLQSLQGESLPLELQLHHSKKQLYQTFLLFGGRAVALQGNLDAVLWEGNENMIWKHALHLPAGGEIGSFPLYAITFPISEDAAFTSEKNMVQVSSVNPS